MAADKRLAEALTAGVVMATGVTILVANFSVELVAAGGVRLRLGRSVPAAIAHVIVRP
jgi:hypothetical protein